MCSSRLGLPSRGGDRLCPVACVRPSQVTTIPCATRWVWLITPPRCCPIPAPALARCRDLPRPYFQPFVMCPFCGFPRGTRHGLPPGSPAPQGPEPRPHGLTTRPHGPGAPPTRPGKGRFFPPPLQGSTQHVPFRSSQWTPCRQGSRSGLVCTFLVTSSTSSFSIIVHSQTFFVHFERLALTVWPRDRNNPPAQGDSRSVPRGSSASSQPGRLLAPPPQGTAQVPASSVLPGLRAGRPVAFQSPLEAWRGGACL